ncbi:MAG: hypothetical protein GXP40_11600, partial [Chloroflexi bacterium]|nr:hypothetical protein [Chloroflexota bacterium]
MPEEIVVMSPRVKFGLLAGTIGLVLNTCVSGLFGICGPLVSLLAGGAAGFFAARGEKRPAQGEGAKVGAIAGAISGALVLVGQIIGGLAALVFLQSQDFLLQLGVPPSPSNQAV